MLSSMAVVRSVVTLNCSRVLDVISLSIHSFESSSVFTRLLPPAPLAYDKFARLTLCGDHVIVSCVQIGLRESVLVNWRLVKALIIQADVSHIPQKPHNNLSHHIHLGFSRSDGPFLRALLRLWKASPSCKMALWAIFRFISINSLLRSLSMLDTTYSSDSKLQVKQNKEPDGKHDDETSYPELNDATYK